MEFIERRGEAADDPIFGKAGETKQFLQRRNPRCGLQPLPANSNAIFHDIKD